MHARLLALPSELHILSQVTQDSPTFSLSLHCGKVLDGFGSLTFEVDHFQWTAYRVDSVIMKAPDMIRLKISDIDSTPLNDIFVHYLSSVH